MKCTFRPFGTHQTTEEGRDVHWAASVNVVEEDGVASITLFAITTHCKWSGCFRSPEDPAFPSQVDQCGMKLLSVRAKAG